MNLDGVFKAYDIRGKVPEQLTPELAYDIGRALADLLSNSPAGGGPVAVGRDMRPSSASLADHLIKGLTHQGRVVWEVGLITSDMLYFAVDKYKLAGGAMVTASHNPGGDGGIKLCAAEAMPIADGSGLEVIKQTIQQRSFKDATPEPAEMVKKQLNQDWLAHVLSLVDANKWPAYKVAFDAGNGMAGTVLADFTAQTALTPVPLFYDLDGSFPNRPSDPTKSENLVALRDCVVDQRLDFGVAFDGDGDRAVFVNEAGKLVSPNLIMALFSEAALSKFPGSPIVVDVRVSRLVEELIKQRGGTLVRAPVGNPHMIAAMRKHNAPLGGELSAHYYFRDNGYACSGLIAAAVLIDCLAASGKTLSQAVAPYQKYAQAPELSFEVSDSKKVIDGLAQKYGDGKQEHIDGLRVDYDDWWFVARPSNTEPLLRLNLEATTADLLNQKLQELEPLIT